MTEVSVHVLCQYHGNTQSVFLQFFSYTSFIIASSRILHLIWSISAQYLAFELKIKIQCEEAYGGMMGRQLYMLGQYPASF